MKTQYTVFSAHVKNAEAEVALPDGTKVNAKVPALEVQLVPVAPSSNGTISLVLTGKAGEEACALFVEGAIINAEFSKLGE